MEATIKTKPGNEVPRQKVVEQPEKNNWKWMLKAGIYAGLGLLTVWGLKYVFKIVSGTIRAFKDLNKSIDE